MAPWAPLLFWLLCVIVATIGIVYLITTNTLSSIESGEGFISMSACPSSTTTYITSAGDTNCCDSDVVNRQCNGHIVCSLSPNPPNGIPTCSEFMRLEREKRNARFCAPSVPYYYGPANRKLGSVEGCSASQPTADGTAPSDPAKPTCKIYQTSVDEYGKVDSCFNKKALDDMAVPTPSATKHLMPTTNEGNVAPALLSATYIPKTTPAAVLMICYDWNRMELYYNAIDPSGQTSRIESRTKDRNVYFCGAAKAYYIDGTLSITKAIGVR